MDISQNLSKIVIANVVNYNLFEENRQKQFAEIVGVRIDVHSNERMILSDDHLKTALGRVGEVQQLPNHEEEFVGYNYKNHKEMKESIRSENVQEKQEENSLIEEILIEDIDQIENYVDLQMEKGEQIQQIVICHKMSNKYSIMTMRKFCSCEFLFRTVEIVQKHRCKVCNGVSYRDEMLSILPEETHKFFDSVPFLLTKSGDIVVALEGKFYGTKIVKLSDLNVFVNQVNAGVQVSMKVKFERPLMDVMHGKNVRQLSSLMEHIQKVREFDFPDSLILGMRIQIVFLPPKNNRMLGFRVYNHRDNMVMVLPWNIDLEDYLYEDIPVLTNESSFFRDFRSKRFTIMRLEIENSLEEAFQEWVQKVSDQKLEWYNGREIRYGLFIKTENRIIVCCVNHSYFITEQYMQCIMCCQYKGEVEMKIFSDNKFCKSREGLCIKCVQTLINYRKGQLLWRGIDRYYKFYTKTEQGKWKLDFMDETFHLFDPFIFHNQMPMGCLVSCDTVEELNYEVSLRIAAYDARNRIANHALHVIDEDRAEVIMYLIVMDHLDRTIDDSTEASVTGGMLLELMENDLIANSLAFRYKYSHIPKTRFPGTLIYLKKINKYEVRRRLKEILFQWMQRERIGDTSIAHILGLILDEDPLWLSF